MKKIDPKEIRDNAMQLIGHDWMLVTAGTPEHFNMMTASWGGLGFMWKKPVAFVVIRPQRHTFGFIEAGEEFTLSFFSHEYHKALTVCGTTSGRDTDKVAASGLTPCGGSQSGSLSGQDHCTGVVRRAGFPQDVHRGDSERLGEGITCRKCRRGEFLFIVILLSLFRAV